MQLISEIQTLWSAVSVGTKFSSLNAFPPIQHIQLWNMLSALKMFWKFIRSMQKEIEGAIISSVVPPITNVIRDSIHKITDAEVLIVGPGVKPV